MCGLLTVINSKKKEYAINDYLSCIENRGPDDSGWVSWTNDKAEYGKNNTVLTGELIQGHRRLSILDLSNLGWQPMKSKCGRYSLVYNGEIYNYVELKRELESLGIVFRSESDTEVLLEGLIYWKENLLPKLRGMFAFTFYDSTMRELLVARDQFGIKPLFYSMLSGGIMFSSEIQQLLLSDEIDSDIDPRTVYEYLHTGASEQSSDSMFKYIKSFPVASYAKIQIDKCTSLSIERYWDIDLSQQQTPTFSEATSRVRELFLESVKLHMRSDVEVGAALSGGIDSSAIVCAMRYLNPEQNIHTFSYIADEANISEEKWIDIINCHVNATVHKIKVTKEELVSDLDDLITTQGEPFSGTNLYAQYRVFKSAKENGIKVMLDGQGADEMLAGYLYYQSTILAKHVKSFKLFKAWSFATGCIKNTSATRRSLVKSLIVELVPVDLFKFVKNSFLKKKKIKWLCEKWIEENKLSERHFYKRPKSKVYPLKAHLKSSMCELGIPKLLRYEDRNSMRWSVESRVPFLHIDLVEYLYSLPEEYLLSKKGVSKYVFREAMRGIVPDEILDRKDKIGFSTPEKSWLTRMDLWVRQNLEVSQTSDMFVAEELTSEWSRVMSGESKFDFRCWRWINLIKWIKLYGK